MDRKKREEALRLVRSVRKRSGIDSMKALLVLMFGKVVAPYQGFMLLTGFRIN